MAAVDAMRRQEPRSRTFTGCRTCRNRHLKCDEARPTCSSCRRLGLECKGYAPHLLWMTHDSSDQDPIHKTKGSSYRFPLFTEDVRESFSLELTQSLGDQLAGNALADLDGVAITSGDDEVRLVGPFGVFRVFDDPNNLPTPSQSESERDDAATCPRDEDPPPPNQYLENHMVAYDALDSWHETPFPNQDTRTHQRNTFAKASNGASACVFAGESALENWQNIPRSDAPIPVLDPRLFSEFLGELPSTSFEMDFSSDIEDWMISAQFDDQTHISVPVDNASKPTTVMAQGVTPLGQSTINSNSDNRNQAASHSVPAGTDGAGSEADSNFMTETILRHDPIPVSPRGGRVLPLHADQLLRYLKQEVLSPTNPAFPSRISPWKELLLPCGLETYAEISLWNQSSHTRLSILCTLLSKSAYHLHKSCDKDPQMASHWLGIAVKHQRDAQEHLKCALITEQEPGGSVKYTDILMAMLGVGFVMIYFNRPVALKKILIDAERLIRLRGFPSKKSFRLRVLHHMYTHLRVIMESTNVSPSFNSSAPASPRLNSPNNSMAMVPAGKFRVAEASLGKLDSHGNKPDEVGYNDIHLEVSGNWHMTMYPEMYGIPESLMTLHAQTISLVNEKPKLELAALSDPSIAIALKKHIKTLEQQIWTWKQTNLMGPDKPPHMLLVAADSPSQPNKPDFNPLALAIKQALIIYFYRRVYDMSAMIMQDEVRKTLDYIQPYLEIGKYDQDFAITIGWVLFLAACEASLPDLQKRSMECLEIIDNCGVFVETSKPSTTAKAVWQRREESGDLSFGWPDLMV